MRANAVRMLFAIGIGLFGAGCGLVGPSDDFVDMEGVVWGRCVHTNPTVAGPCTYMDPVNGAVVSTSLDSATATTDASGRFSLVTQTAPAKDYGCKPYTLTIRASGYPTYSVTGTWGSHGKNQTFTMATSEPAIVGSGITPC